MPIKEKSIQHGLGRLLWILELIYLRWWKCRNARVPVFGLLNYDEYLIKSFAISSPRSLNACGSRPENVPRAKNGLKNRAQCQHDHNTKCFHFAGLKGRLSSYFLVYRKSELIAGQKETQGRTEDVSIQNHVPVLPGMYRYYFGERIQSIISRIRDVNHIFIHPIYLQMKNH